MNNMKFVWGGILIAMVIAIGGYFFPQTKSMFGSISSIGTSVIGTTLTGGSSPTVFGAIEAGESLISDGPSYFGGSTASPVNNLQFGTCNLWVGTSTVTTIAASTTKAVDCQASNGLATGSTVLNGTALAGIKTGDTIVLVAPTTTATTTIVAVNASSTAGYITAIIYNGTGASFTFGSSTANSYHYWDAR